MVVALSADSVEEVVEVLTVHGYFGLFTATTGSTFIRPPLTGTESCGESTVVCYDHTDVEGI